MLCWQLVVLLRRVLLALLVARLHCAAPCSPCSPFWQLAELLCLSSWQLLPCAASH